MCPKCTHAVHTGYCGLPVERLGMHIDCECVVATPRSTNLQRLRQNDAIQQMNVQELKRSDWNRMTKAQQERVIEQSGKKYRRM